MSDDGGMQVRAGGGAAREISPEEIKQMGGMFIAGLVACLVSWRDIMSLPRVLCAFFDDSENKMRFPWTFYMRWVYYLTAIFTIMTGAFTSVIKKLTTGSWMLLDSMGSAMIAAALIATFGRYVMDAIEKRVMARGDAWAWVPGWGYIGKDGKIHPMPWPAWIRNFPIQIGPKNCKMFSVERNHNDNGKGKSGEAKETDARILPPAVHVPFALGPANVNETVLRGTKVVDGYAYRLAMEREWKARGEPGLSGGLLTVGCVPVQYPNEQQHFAICGKPGSGKSQVINGFLRTIRNWRGNSGIIADPAGGYLARFGRETDAVLCPFDARSEGWSPFADIFDDYDCDLIAKATIPENSESEWNHYAQSLLTEVLRAMWKKGERSPKRVLYYCATAPVTELAMLLEGTPAAVLTQKGNDRMLGNVRGIISTYMGAWQYLKDESELGGDEYFSIRKFVRQQADSKDGGRMLFITYTDAQMAMLKFLIATWMELAVIEGLCLTESRDRRFWIILDELDSLGKISSLKLGLTKLRKYSVCVVAGFQTVAQLRSTYGREDAQVLVSAMASKLILAPGDAQTAESMSQELGEQEIEREQITEGQSKQRMEFIGGTDSTNKQLHRETKPAVMPAQLLSLPNMHGYLRMPGSDVLQIGINYVGMPDIMPPYMRASEAAED